VEADLLERSIGKWRKENLPDHPPKEKNPDRPHNILTNQNTLDTLNLHGTKWTRKRGKVHKVVQDPTDLTDPSPLRSEKLIIDENDELTPRW
jgi:hypothetical protein